MKVINRSITTECSRCGERLDQIRAASTFDHLRNEYIYGRMYECSRCNLAYVLITGSNFVEITVREI